MNNEEPLNVNEIKVPKNSSIKTRLQRYFLMISLAIVLIMSCFSLLYFRSSIRREAENLVRNKLVIAEVFLENAKKDTDEFTKTLSDNRALKIGLQLETNSRLKDFIDEISSGNNNYDVSIFEGNGNAVVNKRLLSVQEQSFVTKALEGIPNTEASFILDDGVETPGFVSAYPIEYGGEVIGAVLNRFIFKDNQDFFITLAKNLEVDIAVYSNSRTVISTMDLSISEDLYAKIAYSGNIYESIDLTSKGLNEYNVISSDTGVPCGILHIYLSPYPYLKVFSMAILIYLLIAILITGVVISLVLRVSAEILDPIEKLMQGVNIVRKGNLAYEIILEVQNEIGRLGIAFNELRAQLNDKIITIEDMNSSLEKTISERTATINSLNEKMKHYLSPQLYNSIAGGQRDVSVDKYFRKKLTIFFSDVVSFTSTTESLEPEDLSGLLNSYLDNMARIAEKYGGTIDKYVGDAIMVFFGDPEFTSDKDHALRAVKMAMEMQERMVLFREEWEAKGISNPFHVRMGINTGYCTIGNFGSEMKMDYTIIGNNVNMAARFESSAKPDTILISPDTYTLVKDEIDCVEAGLYHLKGIAEPIKGYSPVRIRNSKVIAKFAKITNNGELVFPANSVNLNNLTNPEKKDLLISIKDIFEKIRNS